MAANYVVPGWILLNFEPFEPVRDLMVLNVPTRMKKICLKSGREHSGSVVDCLTRDRGAAGSSLTGVTALCSLSKTHYPSLVLFQPRKTRPYITERLLMGRKESNQTYKLLKMEKLEC